MENLDELMSPLESGDEQWLRSDGSASVLPATSWGSQDVASGTDLSCELTG